MSLLSCSYLPDVLYPSSRGVLAWIMVHSSIFIDKAVEEGQGKGSYIWAVRRGVVAGGGREAGDSCTWEERINAIKTTTLLG